MSCLLYLFASVALWTLQCNSLRNRSRNNVKRADDSVPVSSSSAFLDGSEAKLIELIEHAEQELKIFIYPMPPEARRCTMEQINGRMTGFPPSSGRMREMFQMEQMLPRYLATIATKDPKEADVFIIYHEWICLRVGNEEFARYHFGPKFPNKEQFSGETIAKEHLKPIFDNVIYNYPFFNQSYGHDHFMTNVFDNGPFCGGAHIQTGSIIHLLQSTCKLHDKLYVVHYFIGSSPSHPPQSHSLTPHSICYTTSTGFPSVAPLITLMENISFFSNNGYNGLNEFAIHGGE